MTTPRSIFVPFCDIYKDLGRFFLKKGRFLEIEDVYSLCWLLFILGEKKQSALAHASRVLDLSKKSPASGGECGWGVVGGPISPPPRKWPLHVLFLFQFVIFIKIWEEDLDKDMILDRVYLKFELRSVCTEIVYSLLHFLSKGMEGCV